MDFNFTPHLDKKDTSVRIPCYSKLHPIIPRLYVPPWKMDMVNRNHILQNATLGGVPTFEHDEPLFLEKREQMCYNSEGRERVDNRYVLPPRCHILKPAIHLHYSRYYSPLMYYRHGYNPRKPIPWELSAPNY
jgi:hypothetical protein